MLKKGIAVILDNDKEYGVIETEIINNNQYCLLVNTKNTNDIKICKLSIENEGVALINLEEKELETIFSIFQHKAISSLKELDDISVNE